ncbi:MAG: glycosyltransferase family 87 protein [Chthoniobacterales bacterium]
MATLWLVVAVAAAIQMIRLSTFAYDANRIGWSVLPTNPFYPTHFCFSGYYEGERFARAGDVNIYDPRQYASEGCEDLMTCPERTIGPLKVDLYQYPPTFLIIPAAISMITRDLLNARALWFLVQVLALAAAFVCTARWVGGSRGRIAVALAPVVFVALPTLAGLQLGNIQATTFAASMLAMVAIATRREAAGGMVLGLMIASKMFPGLLAAWLVGALRWRAVAWTVIGIAASGIAAFVIYGAKPFQDFAAYQAPRIASGEAFFWIDTPVSIPPNYGIHGLIAKLRLLGLTDAGREAGMLASSVYGLLLSGIALLSGWQRRHVLSGSSEQLRMRLVVLWLALLNLGSFRSPFVPDGYAAMGTVWLVTLLVAEGSERELSWRSLAPLGAIVPLSLIVDGFIPAQPPTWVIVLTLANQLLMLGINLWVVGRELLHARVSVPASAVPARAV